MKRSATILSLLLASGIVLSNPASAALGPDITDKHWAYDNFKFAMDRGIVEGDNGYIKPDEKVTRAQFAKMLVKAMDLSYDSSSATQNTFKDVKESDWFYEFVMIAVQKGLVEGKSPTSFEPNSHMSRQEMAVMLNRAVKLSGLTPEKVALTFKDNDKIESWAREHVSSLLSIKLMTGFDDGTFLPTKVASRAESVTVIRRLLELDPENPVKVEPIVNTIPYTSTFEYALQKQVTMDPKADGAGYFIASREAVAYYMHPGTIDQLSDYYYQFLKLNEVISGITTAEINATALNNVGVLSGTGQAFITAGETHKVNFIYLIAHALHETGLGKSKLSTGNRVGLNEAGNPEFVTDDAHAATLKDVRVVYNMYGVGAKDQSPLKLGAERAYKEGWFTVEDAIIGGAQFVSDNYFSRGQDTLYKMKWNPLFPGNLQYATHVEWATIQSKKIADLYKSTGADKRTNSVFEIPVYAEQPAAPVKPTGEALYSINTEKAGLKGVTTIDGLNIRTFPLNGASLGKLPNNTSVVVIGENGNWFKVTASNGIIGWISGDYVKWDMSSLVGRTAVITADLNLREQPSTSAKSLLVIRDKPTVTILEVKDGWYRVKYGVLEGWISSQYTKLNP